MLRAQGTAINIKRKNAGFRWLSAYGNLRFRILFYRPVVIQKHRHRHRADNPIPCKAPLIRNLPKGKEVRVSWKILSASNHRLRIRPGRSITVGGSDCKLSSRCRHPGKKQDYRLRRRHRFIVKQQPRQYYNAGKRREKKDDKRAFFPALPQLPHHRIGQAQHRFPLPVRSGTGLELPD